MESITLILYRIRTPLLNSLIHFIFYFKCKIQWHFNINWILQMLLKTCLVLFLIPATIIKNTEWHILKLVFFFLKPSSNWPNHCSHTVNEETKPKKKEKKRQSISSKWCNTLLLPKKRTHSTRIKVLTLHFAKYTFGRRNPTKKETPQFTKTTFFFLGKKKEKKKLI